MAAAGKKKKNNMLPAQTSDVLDYSLTARAVCGLREDSSARGKIPIYYYFHKTIEHMMQLFWKVGQCLSEGGSSLRTPLEDIWTNPCQQVGQAVKFLPLDMDPIGAFLVVHLAIGVQNVCVCVKCSIETNSKNPDTYSVFILVSLCLQSNNSRAKVF